MRIIRSIKTRGLYEQKTDISKIWATEWFVGHLHNTTPNTVRFCTAFDYFFGHFLFINTQYDIRSYSTRRISVCLPFKKKKNSKTVGRCSNTKVHCTPMRFHYRLTMFALRMMFHTYLDDLLFHYLGAWAFLLILFVENNIFLCYRLLLYNSNLNIY